MKRLLPVIVFATIGLIGIAAVASAETHVVTVKNFEFSPSDLAIQKNDTVRWEWESGTHTVTSGTGPADPDAGNLFNVNSDSAHPTFEFTFTEVGTVDYYCVPHFVAGMTARISVEEGTAVDPFTWSGIKRIFENTSPENKLPF